MKETLCDDEEGDTGCQLRLCRLQVSVASEPTMVTICPREVCQKRTGRIRP
jgi:hypothetical protein